MLKQPVWWLVIEALNAQTWGSSVSKGKIWALRAMVEWDKGAFGGGFEDDIFTSWGGWGLVQKHHCHLPASLPQF